jgi:hypothetical protein
MRRACVVMHRLCRRNHSMLASDTDMMVQSCAFHSNLLLCSITEELCSSMMRQAGSILLVGHGLWPCQAGMSASTPHSPCMLVTAHMSTGGPGDQ